MIYPLVKEMAAVGAPVRVPVAVACRILGFSKQAYYKWLRQPVSAREAEERELIAVLRELHADDPEGGYRVLADDITELGYTVSERRVWRLCRVAGIQSVIVTRTSRYKKAGSPVHDDLVQRQFTAEGPNQLWLTDITEHRTREGKVYLCAIKDVFSNRIVGYSIDSRMKARIAVNALEMAVTHRGQPAGVIVHSDRGSQFRSRKFCKALKRHGLRGSMGRVGACGDNAAMESFFALLQKNVLDRQPWTTRHELRLEIVSWIEGKYHRKRRQRRLGKLTPIEYESSTTPPLHWRHNPGGQPNLQQTPSGCTPNWSATRLIAPRHLSGSFLASNAIRVARCWSSTLYFLGTDMTLILHWFESLHQTRGDSDDDGEVLVPLLVADLVDPDPGQPGEQIDPPRGVVPHAGDAEHR